jgi:hypothetical protein
MSSAGRGLGRRAVKRLRGLAVAVVVGVIVGTGGAVVSASGSQGPATPTTVVCPTATVQGPTATVQGSAPPTESTSVQGRASTSGSPEGCLNSGPGMILGGVHSFPFFIGFSSQTS